ncbi:MAG: hypothetical protein CL910_17815 [Deltaproteobacteria bacterium]|nr:hypothetical protein [Deltaproteobacteria bacterium]
MAFRKGSKAGGRESATDQARKTRATVPTLEDLTKVRDILIGHDLQTQRDAVESLERSLTEQLGRLGSEMDRKLAELQESITRRFAAADSAQGTKLADLATRIRNEGDLRLEGEGRLEAELARQKAAFEAAFADLRATSSEAEGKLRSQLLEQGKLLSASIQRHHEEALRKASEELAGVDHRKADRSTLANLLTDFAVRLEEGEEAPAPPADED